MQHQRYTIIDKDKGVLSAWQEQLAGAAQNPKLMQHLLGRERELLPRFAEHYSRLRTLPRRMRRAMQRRWKRSLAALALLLALGVAPVHGATITVTAPSPHINADGKCSLIEAIVNANDDAQTHTDCAAGSGADTIVLPPGSTQTLTSINNSTYGYTGLPVITSEITIEGSGSTIERDSGADEFRIFVVGRSGDLTLQETTVSGGAIYSYNGGGGMLNFGTLTVTNSTISDNFATNGGGMFNYGTLTLTNSTISDNDAADYGTGGGVFNSGTLTVTNSTISGNSAGDEGYVAGVFNSGTLTVTNSTISDNGQGETAGGVLNYSFGTLTMTNSTISGNFFGGVINLYGGTATVTNSTISGNYGGVSNYGTLTLTNSTISGNSLGGVNNSYGGTATVTNSTISGNDTYNEGGGVFNSGTLTVTNSTISGNSAYNEGGGVDNFGTLTLARTIVSGNTAPSGPEIDNYLERGTIYANNYNLFGHSGNSGVVGFSPGATDIVPTEPLSSILDPTLADNGGPTQTHALVPGSPAIDASPDDEDCQPTDQRGVPRPQGEACDIGAFEFQAQFRNLGQCISTLIKQNCSGLKGKKRAACNHQQQQFCKSLFKGNR